MTDDVMREPPNSIEAEKSVIGAVLIDNKVLNEIALIIDRNDFYQPNLAIIYDVMLSIAKESSSIDIISLTNKLTELGLIDQLEEAITGIVKTIQTSYYSVKHAKIIKAKSFQRQSIKYAYGIIEGSYGEFKDTLSSLENQPSININKNKHKATSDLVKSNIEDIVTRMVSKETYRGMRTGFTDLDQVTDGIKGAEVIGFYAESNAGKSIFASDIARYISKHYGHVGLFAYEMLAEDITYRMVAAESQIPVNTLNKPKQHLNDKELKKLNNYDCNTLDKIHIYADELETKTAHEVNCKIATIPNLKLIILDYLHLMSPMNKAQNDIDKYTNVLREVKHIATQNRTPVLLLMSQNAQGRFRGTEELKHDLDQLWELEREGEDANKEVREAATIKIRKGRNNGKGSVKLWYDEDYLTFRNLEHGGWNK